MNTLLLDQTAWDLCLDASGDIAMASDPYASAQDVASAARTQLGEVWYDTTQGIPYFNQILGQAPPLQLLKSQIVAAALTVPGVSAAVVYISEISGRSVHGQIQITSAAGETNVVGF